MNAIEIKNLTKTYKDFKLDNINLTLPSGCILGLVGENGAGKSTTIRLILDIIPRDGGTVTVLGRDNKDSFEITKQDIGVVLDKVGFYEGFTAKDICKIMKHSYKNWNSEVFYNHLEKFEVSVKKKFRELSKGMQMKLGIAVALSHDAKLLILDEATSGLDPVIRDEILDIFAEFTRDESHSVLISSHITSDLEKICDYFAFMRKGQIVLFEEKDKLLEKYGVIHCTAEEAETYAEDAVIGRKETAYGVELIVERELVPVGTEFGAVDIEQLFICMMKENA